MQDPDPYSQEQKKNVLCPVLKVRRIEYENKVEISIYIRNTKCIENKQAHIN